MKSPPFNRWTCSRKRCMWRTSRALKKGVRSLGVRSQESEVRSQEIEFRRLYHLPLTTNHSPFPRFDEDIQFVRSSIYIIQTHQALRSKIDHCWNGVSSNEPPVGENDGIEGTSQRTVEDQFGSC